MSDSYTLYQEGRIAMESGDFIAAIEKLRASAEESPHFKTLECLGECFLEQEKYGQAIIYLAASTELGNKPFRGYFLLAKSFLAFGEKDEAIARLKKALEINPDYKSAKILLTDILEESEKQN
jgi:tetratricopeptide (TPR) repeat protein